MKNAIIRLGVTVWILLLSTAYGFTNDLDKALEALQEKNFTEAKKMLDQMLEKSQNDPGVYYGLAVYYADSDNQAYNPFEAYTQATLSQKYYAVLREKDAAALIKKGITQQRLQDLQQKTGIDALQQAKTANSLDSLEKVIGHFQGLRNIVTLARDLRDELAFAQAQEINTYQAFQSFIVKYPNAKQIPLAKEKYEQLLFESLTAAGTVQAYELFYKNYPNSPHRTKAKELYEKGLYDNAVAQHSLEAYQTFLRDYPQNAYAPEARQQIALLNMRLPIRQGAKWGYINGCGKIIIAPTFEKAGSFAEGIARVRQNGKWGYIDDHGRIIIRPVFDAARDFSEGLAIVLIKKQKKAAYQTFYIDINGKPVFEKIYDTDGTYMPIHSYKEGYAAVEDAASRKLGFIDKQGNYVIAPLFTPYADVTKAMPDYPFSGFSEGFAWVKEGNTMGLIGKNGQFLLKGNFQRSFTDSTSITPHYWQSFSEGLCPVREGSSGQVVYIDPAGKKVITLPPGTVAFPFSEGVAWIKRRGEEQFKLIDKQGKELSSISAYRVSAFCGGVAAVQKEAPAKRVYFYDELPQEKIVYVDKTGKNPFKLQFTVVKDPSVPFLDGNFRQGLACVLVEGKQTYINTKGEVVWRSTEVW